MAFSRQVRIWIMLCINGAFFLAEISIGYYVSSLALVADSFHMLNDMLSLAVALWAIKAVLKIDTNPKYSYGWQRAEILGALINAVFLLALCVMIVIEAIQRFVSPEPVTDPLLVLITGCCGLAGNLVGLFLFHEHGHGHHHHHSHDEEKHEHHDHGHNGHLNMKGIFLHVLGDALGNIGVIVTALFIWLTDWSWRYYLDPIVSLVISAIIFASAIPLVRQTSSILLQAVPTSISLDKVREDLLQLDGVVALHELHIWQLSDTKHIASVHVLLSDQTSYMAVASSIRQLMHRYNVHSVTIQPEFSSLSDVTPSSSSETLAEKPKDAEDEKMWDSSCMIRCTDNACVENACCPLQKADSRSLQ